MWSRILYHKICIQPIFIPFFCTLFHELLQTPSILSTLLYLYTTNNFCYNFSVSLTVLCLQSTLTPTQSHLLICIEEIQFLAACCEIQDSCHFSFIYTMYEVGTNLHCYKNYKKYEI